MSRARPALRGLAPIDDAARNGRNQLVADGTRFAIAAWRENAWRFPNGHPLDFQPERYRP